MYKYFTKNSNTGYISEWKSINAEAVAITLMIHMQKLCIPEVVKT